LHILMLSLSLCVMFRKSLALLREVLLQLLNICWLF